MTKAEFIKLIENIPDDDAIVVSQGNSYLSFKITGVEDSTCVGVWEIRFTDFETGNFWEE